MVGDVPNPNLISGCDLDFSEDPTRDEDLDVVVLTGGSRDIDVVESKLNEYKELFPNG